VATRDAGAIKKGQRVWTCGGSSGGGFGDIVEGLGGALVDCVGGLVNLGAPVVNWASSTYNSAKSAAVGVVVDALKNTVGCGAGCQWAVGAAVDAGLMAMGVPPTLPDFDQLAGRLTDQGIDALADAAVSAAASQGVPLPKEVAKAALYKLKNDAIAAATSGGHGGAGQFYQPDPALAYSPAAMVLEVRNSDNLRSTQPSTLRIVNGRTQKGAGDYDFMTTGSGGGRFHTVNIPVPSLKPRTSVRLVARLDPFQDPHEWLALTQQGWDLSMKAAAVKTCQAPAAFAPDPESAAHKKYQQCKLEREHQVASIRQAASNKYGAATMNREAWTKVHTTTELGFEIRLLSNGQTASETFVRCPPRAGLCSQ
jgi:hypothetical protein